MDITTQIKKQVTKIWNQTYCQKQRSPPLKCRRRRKVPEGAKWVATQEYIKQTPSLPYKAGNLSQQNQTDHEGAIRSAACRSKQRETTTKGRKRPLSPRQKTTCVLISKRKDMTYGLSTLERAHSLQPWLMDGKTPSQPHASTDSLPPPWFRDCHVGANHSW